MKRKIEENTWWIITMFSQVILLALKLTNGVEWGWWLILLPILINVAIFASAIFYLGIMAWWALRR